MLYRAQDKIGTSRLGYAESSDGIHFTRASQPVLSPETDYEKDGGVEDPRLVKFADDLLSDLHRLQQEGCTAVSGDFQGFAALAAPRRDSAGLQRQLECGLDKIRSHRAGKDQRQVLDVLSLAPAPTRRTRWGWPILPDLFHWTEATDTPVLPRRAGRFDSRVVEPGPPPIVTKDGIVLFYNAADDNLVYRTAIAVFDRKDPRKLIWRSEQPIFFQKRPGRRSARFRMWFLWRGWSGSAAAICSTTARRTSTSAWPKSQSFPDH